MSQCLESERCEELAIRLKKIQRGRVHVHTRSVSGGSGELLHQKVKQDEVRLD